MYKNFISNVNKLNRIKTKYGFVVVKTIILIRITINLLEIGAMILDT